MKARKLTVSKMPFAVHLCRIAVLLGAIQGSKVLADEHWPSFQNGGNSSPTSTSLPLSWSVDEGIVWSAEISGYGQSSPIIWGQNVYVTSCSGDMKEKLLIQCFDLNTGKRTWQHQVSNSSPEKNSQYVSRAAPTPVADKRGVIVFFEGGNLCALSHDGKVRWERDLTRDYGPIKARHGLGSSLEQDAESVFVWVERAEEPYVAALSKATGKTIWKSPGVGKTSWATPRLVPVGGGQHLVLSASGRIVGLDPATGKKLWQFEGLAGNSSQTPFPLGDSKILIGAAIDREAEAQSNLKSNGVLQITSSGNGQFVAEFVWRAEKATSSFGSPIVAGDKAYFVNRSGVLYCLDKRTGVERFVGRIAESIWATPIHVEDRIYFFGRGGVTTVIRDSDRLEVLAKNSLWKSRASGRRGTAAEPSMAGGAVLYGAAVAGQRLVLRRGDQLYCIAGPKN